MCSTIDRSVVAENNEYVPDDDSDSKINNTIDNLFGAGSCQTMMHLPPPMINNTLCDLIIFHQYNVSFNKWYLEKIILPHYMQWIDGDRDPQETRSELENPFATNTTTYHMRMLKLLPFDRGPQKELSVSQIKPQYNYI